MYFVCLFVYLFKRPQCNHPTVLDLLDVREPNVMNVLIDQVNVESILLIRTRSEANRVITHERPRGAKAAYTLDGDMVLHYAHYSNKFGRLGILRESVEAAVREEEARFSGLERELDGLQREAEAAAQGVTRDQRCVQDAAGKIRRRMSDKRSLKTKIEELLNAQEEEEPEEDIATYVSLQCATLNNAHQKRKLRVSCRMQRFLSWRRQLVSCVTSRSCLLSSERSWRTRIWNAFRSMTTAIKRRT